MVFLVGIGIGAGLWHHDRADHRDRPRPSLVVTLAMLYIIRGVDTLSWATGQVVANSLPQSFINIFHATILGIPDLAIAAAVVVAVAAYYLRSFAPDATCTRSGPTRGRPPGRHPDRQARVLGVRAVSGAIAGIGGVVVGDPVQHDRRHGRQRLELQVIAAVVVGGVAIFGGSGSVVGAALGALLLQTISSALNVLGVTSIWTEAIAGFLLLVAITLDRGIQLRLAAALRKRRVHLGA